jgi:subtilase family protein
MSDHGLFIAGIISDYVPADNMNIYLVETQNNHGVGTIKTLAQGITALINGDIIPEAEMGNPLIVNCSLCVSFLTLQELRDNLHLIVSIDRDVDTMKRDFDTMNLAQINDLAEMLSLRGPLLELENRFAKTGVRIIAAAGNDSIPPGEPRDESQDRPPCEQCPTRYPAALECVLGVGAVERGGNRALYSNIPDVPPDAGLMVFGGKAQRRNKKNTTDNTGGGMLGLYVGKFPKIKADGTLDETTDGTPSDNGWAWWAGTSFATAVVSGIFACAAAKGQDINRGASPAFLDLLKSKEQPGPGGERPFIDIPQGV